MARRLVPLRSFAPSNGRASHAGALSAEVDADRETDTDVEPDADGETSMEALLAARVGSSWARSGDRDLEEPLSFGPSS
ncbi:hypothetical protein ASF32_17835 [Methylobacterium sp. Leaf91]|nr:hypothetical protein ASF32_17835 [Methylobacterium sp. Leaf91]